MDVAINEHGCMYVAYIDICTYICIGIYFGLFRCT